MTLAALASIMMIAFGASGMDGAVRTQAAATGTQPLTYVGQLLNRWLSSTASNLGFSTLATVMQEGMSYLPDGTLYLDSDATAAVADFQRWAWDSDGGGLVFNAPVAPSSDGEYTDGTHTILRLDSTLSLTSYTSNTSYSGEVVSNFLPLELKSGLYIGPYLVGNQVGQYVMPCYMYFLTQADGANAAGLYLMGNDASYTWVRVVQGSRNLYRSGSFYLDPSQFVLAPSNFGITADNVSPDIPKVSQYIVNLDNFAPATGDYIADPDTFVGPMQAGQGTQLPLSDKVTVSADAAARLHLDNYLRAVAAAYAGSGTVSVPVTDVGSGDEDTLPLSVPLDTPIGVTGVSDTVIDQSGSVAGSDAVATDFEGLDDYTMDLTQFFPFCVPFDLAYLFERLRADPEALVIDWHFLIPYLDVDIPIQIDLSPFDSLAQLLRSLEVIAFIVALLVGTKNLIQGGD